MRKRRSFLLLIAAVLLLCLVGGAVAYYIFGSQVNVTPIISDSRVADISVPPGFNVNVFAEGLNNPRFLGFDPGGILYVADRQNNRIVSLPDQDGDGVADEIKVFADGLDRPHSLAFHEGAWYIGVPSGVVRLQDTDGDGTADSHTILIDDISPTGTHRTRTVAFLPDGRMVLSVGSTCNVCQEEDPQRAAILVYDSSKANEVKLFATGLRNAVGLAIHPETGELWATNNGRDLMGDDLPPDTINIVREGANYGWPFCHSGTIVDPNIGNENSCDGVEPSLVDLQAHSAPLGLVFYPVNFLPGDEESNGFPEEYQGDLFIAYHGSWNRSTPTGYKVVRLPLDGSQPSGPVEDFAVGWLNEDNGSASGRPVGLAVGPDGSLFVSDDKGGIIYRISYAGSSQ